MNAKPANTSQRTARARALREQQTKAESLLWNVLRGKRFCGLKFRRQFPVGPFFADFACVSLKVIVELDGGYYDGQYEDDLSRQRYLQDQGWRVLRLANEDVLEDVQAAAVWIARQLGLEARFAERKRAVSGMKCQRKPSSGPAPSPGPAGPTSPSGRGD